MAGSEVSASFLVTLKHHGVLMILSWGLLVPLAASFSFWLRRTPSTILNASSSTLAFFRIHYMTAGMGAILAIAGWVIACRNFERMKWTDNMHGILGTVVMIGAVFNILLYPAMGKPVQETRTARQNVVALIHTCSGYALILLAWITCYLAARYAMAYLQGLIVCWTSVIIANIGLYYNFKTKQWAVADNIALEDADTQKVPSTASTSAALTTSEQEQQLLLPPQKMSHEHYV